MEKSSSKFKIKQIARISVSRHAKPYKGTLQVSRKKYLPKDSDFDQPIYVLISSSVTYLHEEIPTDSYYVIFACL